MAPPRKKKMITNALLVKTSFRVLKYGNLDNIKILIKYIFVLKDVVNLLHEVI